MGRRRRRRGIRRFIRAAMVAALIFGVLPGLYLSAGTGNPAAALLIIPAAMFASLVAMPFVLLALVIAVAAVALPFAILAAVFGGPLYLLYRITSSGSRSAPRSGDDEDEDEALTADTLLRRRYVAGEITYNQFQAGMVALLRDRYARGTITLNAYEAELEKLIAPARHLDVKRDPAVAGAPRGD